MTCKTCHSPFPKLKPYGDEFAANGFALKDQDAPRYYIETGDPELITYPRSSTCFQIRRIMLPIIKAILEQTDFTTPFLFKLLTGGTITKDVAYYALLYS